MNRSGLLVASVVLVAACGSSTNGGTPIAHSGSLPTPQPLTVQVSQDTSKATSAVIGPPRGPVTPSAASAAPPSPTLPPHPRPSAPPSRPPGPRDHTRATSARERSRGRRSPRLRRVGRHSEPYRPRARAAEPPLHHADPALFNQRPSAQGRVARRRAVEPRRLAAGQTRQPQNHSSQTSAHRHEPDPVPLPPHPHRPPPGTKPRT